MRRPQPVSPSHSKVIEKLQRDFDEYRAYATTRKVVPPRLRAAAMAAIDDGLPKAAVKRACGVSSKQLSAWRGHRGEAIAPATRLPTPRVLTVVADKALASKPNVAIRFEIRMWRWSVTLCGAS
jgi:hypothetical protein